MVDADLCVTFFIFVVKTNAIRFVSVFFFLPFITFQTVFLFPLPLFSLLSFFFPFSLSLFFLSEGLNLSAEHD